MSITSQNCKHIYLADGQTRDFEIDFPILSAQDIELYVTTAAGVETKITQNYAVNVAQGTVVYPTLASGLDPVATGCKVTILRVTPLTQEMTLTQQGVLDAKALEGGYDKLTLQLQEAAEQLKRCIKYTVSSGKTDADAATFLAELQSTQTAALNSALASVEAVKTALLQNMSEETTARTQGDLTLQQSIQTLAGTVSSQDSAQTTALAAESSARQSADDNLQTAVSAEAATRLAADTSLAAEVLALQTGKLSVQDAQNTYLTQTNAQSTYVPVAQKSAANGVASLDANALVPESQLPVINGGSANA